MLRSDRTLHFLSFFLVALFICWYVLFESPYLAIKIDTHIHFFRVQNLLNALKSGTIFPSWHESPYWGYPEDFNFYLSYFFLMLTGLILPLPWAFKIFYLVFYFMAGVTAQWSFKRISDNEWACFIAALLYMGAASFANFSLGGGSPPRMAAIVFYPVMVGTFIQFFKIPSRKNAAIFCLAFFSSYMAHPIAALAGCLTLLFTPILVHLPQHSKETFKKVWPIFLMGAFCFSWYFISLFLMKKALSWEDVYQFYSQFRVQFKLKSFFFFWMDSKQRTETFYMGSIPLIISLISPFLLSSRLRTDRIFRYFLCLTLFSFFLILFGQDIFAKNTFRLDLIFNFALAGMTAHLLSFIKWKHITLTIVAIIIFDQTSFFRRFGGMSYVDKDELAQVTKQFGKKLNHPRVLMDHHQAHMVITSQQYESLSLNQWIEFIGALELTPYNLGIIPFIKKIGEYESLYQFLGIPRNDQPAPPKIIKYDHFQKALASSRKEAWSKLYLPQLENSDYFSNLSPIVYQHFDTNSPKLVNSVNESLTIIREAYHPRRIVLSQGKELDTFPVEPGLIGTYSQVNDHKLLSKFLFIEKLAGILTLLSVTALGIALLDKKRFLS